MSLHESFFQLVQLGLNLQDIARIGVGVWGIVRWPLAYAAPSSLPERVLQRALPFPTPCAVGYWMGVLTPRVPGPP